MNENVTEWGNELKILSKSAKSKTQAAFWLGEQNKFKYCLQTKPEMNNLIKPVNEIVQWFLLPPITGEALVQSGGLGILLFIKKYVLNYNTR